MLMMNDEDNACYMLRWKTQNKIQRKGRELDPRYFDKAERDAFELADQKEWKSFLDTGAIEIIPPHQAKKIPKDRIFSRPMRKVLTNKNKKENGKLEAKTRLVTPGDVDPDGETPVEDGGFGLMHLPVHNLLFIYCARARYAREGTLVPSTAKQPS